MTGNLVSQHNVIKVGNAHTRGGTEEY